MFRLALLLTLFVGAPVSAAIQRPNILFIVSEDNGPELGCYGDANALAHNITPTLDQLARDGVLFENAFVPYSVCSPSRACFYTGTHVAQNGHEGLATHKFAMHHLAPTSDTADADTLPKNPLSADEVTTIPWVGATSARLREQTAGYYNCLRQLDDGIAMVLADLDAADLRDNTLVIYIGDHGAQFSRGKTSVYEAGLRVPMIVRWPGSTTDLPGEINPCAELTSTTDIMPTMLRAAGVAIPNQCSGHALQPLLEGRRVTWRKYIFGHATGSAPSLNYI